MTAAPLVKAEDIAWFLASYAKDALATLNEKDATSLKPLRDALETALGLRFEGETNRYASPAAIKSDNLSQFEKHSPKT